MRRSSGLRQPRSSETISEYATIDAVSCHQPWATIFVHEDGAGVPCCWGNRVMGNLNQKRFTEI